MSDTLKNYIDGIWQDASTGSTFKSINPARNQDLVGEFPDSGVEDVDDAAGLGPAAADAPVKIPLLCHGDHEALGREADRHGNFYNT